MYIWTMWLRPKGGVQIKIRHCKRSLGCVRRMERVHLRRKRRTQPKFDHVTCKYVDGTSYWFMMNVRDRIRSLQTSANSDTWHCVCYVTAHYSVAYTTDALCTHLYRLVQLKPISWHLQPQMKQENVHHVLLRFVMYDAGQALNTSNAKETE